MTISAHTLVTIGAAIGAITTILTVLATIHKWFLKQEKQDEDIAAIKEENTLMCYALMACLDGLEQLGANHTVPKAKDKLEKHLNQRAHK